MAVDEDDSLKTRKNEKRWFKTFFSIEEEERVELGEAGSIHVLKYAFCLVSTFLETSFSLNEKRGLRYLLIF